MRSRPGSAKSAWRGAPAVLLAVALAVLPAAAIAQGVVVGTVSRVHDGDTVTVLLHDGQLLVRLAAIDAPEHGQAFGDESRDSLVACALGRPAIVEVQGLDRHGRTLGVLYAAGTDCGLQQLRSGMAWFYRRYRQELPARRRLDYGAAEREARSRRAGLWAADEVQPPWTHRRLHPRPEASPPP